MSWLPVPGYERQYEVSNQGSVRSLYPNTRTKTGLLKARIGSNGYPRVRLSLAGQRRDLMVHTLVAEAFIGQRPEGMEVRHLNGDPLDCRRVNLTYGTKSENRLDSVQHGTHKESRKTHCPQKHEYTPANTRIYRGKRYCRECHRSTYR